MQPKITAVLEASKEVARSKKLKKLLEVILALGNYMNRGQRGNAVGFRISSLNRLTDTKSTSKNTTLLHYLVDVLESKFKDVLKLVEDLPHVKVASKVRYISFLFRYSSWKYQMKSPLTVLLVKLVIQFIIIAVWLSWTKKWLSCGAVWKLLRKRWSTTELRIKLQWQVIDSFLLLKSFWHPLHVASQTWKTSSTTWRIGLVFVVTIDWFIYCCSFWYSDCCFFTDSLKGLSSFLETTHQQHSRTKCLPFSTPSSIPWPKRSWKTRLPGNARKKKSGASCRKLKYLVSHIL